MFYVIFSIVLSWTILWQHNQLYFIKHWNEVYRKYIIHLSHIKTLVTHPYGKQCGVCYDQINLKKKKKKNDHIMITLDCHVLYLLLSEIFPGVHQNSGLMTMPVDINWASGSLPVSLWMLLSSHRFLSQDGGMVADDIWHIITLLWHKKACFDSKMPGSIQKCLVWHKNA